MLVKTRFNQQTWVGYYRSKRRLRWPTNTGFTLVELLVTISVIAVLVGLLIPAVQSVREAGRRTSCANKLRQVTLASLNYESSHRRFPSGLSKDYQSWIVQILPFLEQRSIYRQAVIDFRRGTPFDGSHEGLQKVIDVLQCASDSEASAIHYVGGFSVATTNFLGVAGTNHLSNDGVLFFESEIGPRQISDGLSNTLLAGERPPSADRWYGWWYSGIGQDGKGSADFFLGVEELLSTSATQLDDCLPGPYRYQRGQGEQCDALHFWSKHPGGANFSRCDGSVHFMSYMNSDDEIMRELSTRGK